MRTLRVPSLSRAGGRMPLLLPPMPTLPIPRVHILITRDRSAVRLNGYVWRRRCDRFIAALAAALEQLTGPSRTGTRSYWPFYLCQKLW